MTGPFHPFAAPGRARLGSPWVLAMTWRDLLFMHWPVPADSLRPHVPDSLEVETFPVPGRSGEERRAAWLGIVPFRMTGVRFRFLPALPRLSAFAELSVRTYVRPAGHPRGGEGEPGVWFFRLDASNGLAVAAARALYRLPYAMARMRVEKEGGWIRYDSARAGRGRPPARFRGRYRPTGDPFRAPAGSLESFLTERTCLYAADRRGRLLQTRVSHPPWTLQPAEALVEWNTMSSALGADLARHGEPPGFPLLHFADGLDVVASAPLRLPRKDDGVGRRRRPGARYTLRGWNDQVRGSGALGSPGESPSRGPKCRHLGESQDPPSRRRTRFRLPPE